jgi:glycosyltransferase involved in cell wall biosynthesis
MPGEAMLVVSHTFPPYRGIGGRRWVKFAKALARKGHPVHVICSAGGDDLLGSPWTADRATPGVTVHELPQRYPTVLFKRPLTRLWQKIAYRYWTRVLPRRVKGNYFDKAVLWEEQFVRKASELIERHGIRNVIVSGAPFRLMAHATKLRTRFPHLRLVADFRDPWTWGHVYGHGTLGAEREAYERELEAMVARTFDRLISPAPAIVDHLRNTYGGDASRYVRIPHAIDPDELGTPTGPPDDGVFRMVYAGSLYGAGEAEAYFDTLLQALQRSRELHPQAFAACRLDLYITGHDTTTYEERVKQAGLSGTVRFHAPLPARQIFPILATADVVPIFIPSGNKDFLGTKFTELFYLRRPVLHIGEPGLVSRTITENHLGASVRLSELGPLLPQLIARKVTLSVDESYDLGPHLLDRITDKLIQEVLV